MALLGAMTPVAALRLAAVDWGRTRHAAAAARQLAQVALRAADAVPDTLVFTEHEPVFTVGLRAGAERHLVWTEAERRRAGVELAAATRGGDVTYHGPGQIVGYPIVSLRSRPDLHAYLRLLESVLIATVAACGLPAQRREGLTGIWVGRRKIAAIGIAVKRWVAYHGFALNVDVDLGPFQGIVPCGLGPDAGTVTSLAAELGRAPAAAAVRAILHAEFSAAWPGFLQPGTAEAAGAAPPVPAAT